MVTAMKKVVEKSTELSNEERDLLCVAYKQVVCARISAWALIHSIERKIEVNEKRRQMAKEYREKVQMEIRQICGDVLGLLDNNLLPLATTAKSKMFYRMTKLDFSAYLADIALVDAQSRAVSCPAPPPAPQSTAQINDLKDADLAMIFERLPPYERMLVSDVCCRWRDLSQKSWLDVVTLDLSNVPGPTIAAVVGLCPNLQSVVSDNKKFAYTQLHLLSRLALSTVKLYDCTAFVPETGDKIADAYSAIFSADLQGAAWQELVLHELKVKRKPLGQIDFPASLPRSLKRLQLTGSFLTETQMLLDYASDPSARFLRGLDEMRELECLMLLGNDVFVSPFDDSPTLLHQVSRLRNLRELCIGPVRTAHFAADYTLLPKNLPRLEVLFLHEPQEELTANFLEGIPRLATLRILVITGRLDSERSIPPRRLYPNGFGSDPLLLLHIFLGKEAFVKLTFESSSTDALKVHSITEPLPVFLEKDEIAPIFDGVWIAGQIREGTKRGTDWSDSGEDWYAYDEDDYRKMCQ